jgi:hypothetical protein
MNGLKLTDGHSKILTIIKTPIISKIILQGIFMRILGSSNILITNKSAYSKGGLLWFWNEDKKEFNRRDLRPYTWLVQEVYQLFTLPMPGTIDEKYNGNM